MSEDKLISLAEDIHKNNVEKGFWDGDRNPDVVFALINTEYSEAIEAHREDRWANVEIFNNTKDNTKSCHQYIKDDTPKEAWTSAFKSNIKDSIQDEIADVVIRELDWLYFRHRDHIILPTLSTPDVDDDSEGWSDDFAANIFFLQKQICDRRIADALKYTIMFSEHLEIDLLWHVQQKFKYNTTRSKMHGKAY